MCAGEINSVSSEAQCDASAIFFTEIFPNERNLGLNFDGFGRVGFSTPWFNDVAFCTGIARKFFRCVDQHEVTSHGHVLDGCEVGVDAHDILLKGTNGATIVSCEGFKGHNSGDKVSEIS